MTRAFKPTFNISKFFADTVCGPFNQDISMLLVGKKGTGKSLASLSLARLTASEIAKRRGGTWHDYFSMKNVAIIDPERASDLIINQEMHQVYLYDDIGLGWNARNFASTENKDKNDIFQINRVDRTCQIFSVPNQFLLDKVPRSLVSHYAEMDRTKRGFKSGFSLMKFFEPVTLFREGKQIQPYVSTKGQKFVQIVIPSPPMDLVTEYNRERSRVTRLIREMKKQDKQEAADIISAGGKKAKKRDQVISKVEEVAYLVSQGTPYTKACNIIGISSTTYVKYKDHCRLTPG